MTTIQVTDCNTHAPIALAAVRDSFGDSGYTDSNGYIVELNDVPGTVIYVSAYTYLNASFVLTGQEIQNGFAPVCLTPAPQTGGGGGGVGGGWG